MEYTYRTIIAGCCYLFANLAIGQPVDHYIGTNFGIAYINMELVQTDFSLAYEIRSGPGIMSAGFVIDTKGVAGVILKGGIYEKLLYGGVRMGYYQEPLIGIDLGLEYKKVRLIFSGGLLGDYTFIGMSIIKYFQLK